ncbi:MAG: GIY-YIG nuclease family protein [Candidatus Thorarchaeota archaeon]|nr:GIY-YIG nuclease family protein [Candidatus Thorarchaeota archaeon]
MKGVYALVIQIEKNLTTTVGALGEVGFQRGIWAYVGSATGTGSTNLENRIRRHFTDEKAIHWHIDYLLNTNAIPIRAIWAESDRAAECNLAREMNKSPLFVAGPRGFGASDCTRGCGTHLFRFVGSSKPDGSIHEIFSELGLTPFITEKDTSPKRTTIKRM